MCLCRHWDSGEDFQCVCSRSVAVLGFELSSGCIVVSTPRSEAGPCLISLHLGQTQVQHLYKLFWAQGLSWCRCVAGGEA